MISTSLIRYHVLKDSQQNGTVWGMDLESNDMDGVGMKAGEDLLDSACIPSWV